MIEKSADCRLRTLQSLVSVLPTKKGKVQENKNNVVGNQKPGLDLASNLDANNNFEEVPKKKKLEVLCDGFYYDVTEFIKRHPGGDIMELYTDTGEDATIAIQQFHYRSLKMVMAKMKGLPRRPATDEEVDLDPETKKRHDAMSKDFFELFKEIEAEGLMVANPIRFVYRLTTNFIFLLCGLFFSYQLGHIFICRVISAFFIALAGGQVLWIGHEGGHNSVTGFPKLDRLLQKFGYGSVFGLSASSWNHTHSEHHAMPQHETKDSDLKTMPLIAFNKAVVRNPEQAKNIWLHYQHILFVLCDTFLVVLTWKLNHHIKYAYKNKCYLDLLFMSTHYLIMIPLLGFYDWIFVTWLTSIYVLGNLILSHTHLPVVPQGKKVHWVEYAFLYTTNVKSSWWVDWWTGHLNYQIEHHLFPTMPEYKGKLCRDKVKAFAKRHNLPYQLCSYWEAVKNTYHNLEHVGNELRQM